MLDFRIPDLDLVSVYYEDPDLISAAYESFKLAKDVTTLPLVRQTVPRASLARAEKPLNPSDQIWLSWR